MARPIHVQLYPLFADLYAIAAGKDESKQSIEAALDRIVRELHQESSPRRSETVAEMKQLEDKLGNFDPTNSPAFHGLVRHFGSILSRPELYSIAQCVREMQPTSMTPLTRMERRRKSALLKWYDTNWTTIETLLSRIDFD
jgi:hypothetical protein